MLTEVERLEVVRLEAVRRWWSYVEITPGCWLWKGGTDDWGYGTFPYLNKRVKAHRFAYETFVAPIPAVAMVLHHCDSPPCVNFMRCLHLGDHEINMAEMYGRGRGRKARGVDHHSAKLTEDDVREIRRRYAAGEATQTALGAEFGIAQTIVSSIVRRKLWTHVD